jgi:iron complex transport system substrate-binding protein
MRRGNTALLIIASMAALVATEAAAASSTLGPVRRQLSLRDMDGREVVLAAAPQRIVSLVPSATETIYALGGENRLVGRTDFCDHPPAAREKTSVGGMINPNLETVVALRPDLVIATNSGNRDETFKQLGRLRIPVYLVGADRIAEVKEVARRLGALTGRDAAVAPLLDHIDRRVAAVRDAVKAYGRPRVLYVLWPDPLIVPGRTALVTELIDIAGGDSITATDAEAYPRYSLEAAVAKAPEVIVLANHGSRSGPIAIDRWKRLTSLPAMKSGRIHSVEGNLMHRYGPRLLDGLDQLARAIHPEAFR